jgi:hypothetical protein
MANGTSHGARLLDARDTLDDASPSEFRVSPIDILKIRH